MAGRVEPYVAVLKHYVAPDPALAAFYGCQVLGQYREQWRSERCALERLSLTRQAPVAKLLSASPRFQGLPEEAVENQELMLVMEHAGEPLAEQLEPKVVVRQLMQAASLAAIC